MKKAFQIFDATLGRIESYISVLMFVIIICLTVTNVFFRYVLRTGIQWSDELIQILMVYMVMFGCAYATRTKGHVELNGLVNKMPKLLRTIARTIIAIVSVGFLGVFLFSALKHTTSTGNLETVILRIPRKYCYISLPIGAVLTLYEFIKTIPYRINHDPKDDDVLAEVSKESNT